MRVRSNTAVALPDVSADFTRFVFHIRSGIHFADDPAFGGRRRELTAADYVYTLKRDYDPRWKSGKLYLLETEKILGLSELRAETIAQKKPFDYDRDVPGLRALDRYRFEVRLAQPSPRFHLLFTDASLTGAMAREVVEHYGEHWHPDIAANPPRKALIIHGFESSAINFDRYVRPLLKKGYEVLAVDAPAHGRRGGKQVNAPLYKKTIQAVYKQFGPIQSFMAHSFGGLAVSLALEEISHTTDYRLVLIAPATETTTAIETFFHFLKRDPAIRPEFDKVIIKKGGVTPAWYSLKRAMKHIRAKVLWVHDEEDDTTPLSDALKVKAENHPNIQFVITKGLGHRRIYRDNKVTKQIVEFL